MIRISFPVGSIKEVSAGTSILEVAEAIGPRLAKAAVSALVNGEHRDLRETLAQDAEVTIYTSGSPQALETLRHTTTHIMAQAVKRLFPDAKLGIGPAIADGFYYDFNLASTFSEEDLERIAAEMKAIIEADLPIVRKELPVGEARALLESQGETLKLELLDELEDGTISFFEQGEFVDLCRGPHLQSTGRVKFGALKLLSVAGAYWRGDENRPMLQRI